MDNEAIFPQQHTNSVLERTSEKYFNNCLPDAWYAERPEKDFGIDLTVTPVINSQVIGLNFSVQLKAKGNTAGKLEVRLKKSTLNFLFTRLEPVMIVLYDDAAKKGYWKWLVSSDFDLNQDLDTFAVKFDEDHDLTTVNWSEVAHHVQRIFKVKNRLLLSLEYDLFSSVSEAEARAWSHYVSRNFAEAAFCFKRLIQLEQLKPVWFVVLARCYYEEYDYGNALLNINKAIEHDTADDVLLTKGSILAEDGINRKDQRKIIEANKIFEALFAKKPSATNAYNYANTLSQLGDKEQAIKLYKKVIDRQPNNAEAWKNLGQVYYDLKEHEKEMTCYDNALRINPNLLQARVCQAITEGRVYQRYEKAIATLIECINGSDRLTLEFPTSYYDLGLFLWRVNRPAEALPLLSRGLDHHPSNRWLLSLKSELLHELVKKEGKKWAREAITFFQSNYAIDHEDHISLFYWCSALAGNGEESKAAKMACAWLQDRVFPGPKLAVVIADLALTKALLMIKNYDVLRLYLPHRQLLDILRRLKLNAVGKPNEVARAIHVQRMTFLAEVADRSRPWKQALTLEDILVQFDASFLQINVAMLEDSEKAQQDRGQLEYLADRIATAVSTLCMEEAMHCIEQVQHTLREGKGEAIPKEWAWTLLSEALGYFHPMVSHQIGLEPGS